MSLHLSGASMAHVEREDLAIAWWTVEVYIQMTAASRQPHASLGRNQSVLLLYKWHGCPWLCQQGVNISCAECEESYITHSVPSHGSFSVNSARTNFTVLKQLMVPKECVMSCHEIWLFPVCMEKTSSSLGLIRNNFSIKPTTRALGRACIVQQRWLWKVLELHLIPTFVWLSFIFKLWFNTYDLPS